MKIASNNRFQGTLHKVSGPLNRDVRQFMNIMKNYLAFIICLTLFGCSASHPLPTRNEIAGTQAERVARATSILSKYCVLPGALLDAHMVEDIQDNSGGMVPGPSESWLSGVIVIPIDDIPKWQQVLAPALSAIPDSTFTSPIAPPSWWSPLSTQSDCVFYAPNILTGRSGGFVAISPTDATIYFSTTKK